MSTRARVSIQKPVFCNSRTLVHRPQIWPEACLGDTKETHDGPEIPRPDPATTHPCVTTALGFETAGRCRVYPGPHASRLPQSTAPSRVWEDQRFQTSQGFKAILLLPPHRQLSPVTTPLASMSREFLCPDICLGLYISATMPSLSHPPLLSTLLFYPHKTWVDKSSSET